MRYLLILAFLLVSLIGHAQSQEMIHGKVTSKDGQGEEVALVGANVYWLGTTAGTITDLDGNFKLAQAENIDRLVISFIGYVSDTVLVQGKEKLTVSLVESIELETVEVEYRRKTTEIDFLNPLKSEQISEKELLKAACCNLSESFETNPSVDVSFTDAVTGTRQIQMLGLAGPYSQITRENMPDIRGLSSIYGMVYIPGTWIESIQLNKGTGSVINGYESVAGQINIELRKPEDSDKIYANLYANQGGRFEGNLNWSHKLNDKWSTAVLLHGKLNQIKMDRNDDDFLDMPLSEQFIALNRWKYSGDGGLRLQLGIKTTLIDNVGGQKAFDPKIDVGTTNAWGMKGSTRRIEGWTKIGHVYADQPWKSFGFQLSGVSHDYQSTFGLTKYDGNQQSFYANSVFQSIFDNSSHVFRAGASLQYDKYDERLNQADFDRTEVVPGAFFEYTYSYLEKFNAMIGIRADHHNLCGSFFTPRAHLRYAITDQTALRASIGRGQRTANVIAENIGILASSRDINILGDESDKPYGLDAEVAWNIGVNLTQEFRLDYRDGAISIDYYRTNFENQIVLDLDQDPQQALFYNLNGSSYSNSFQVQLDYELIRRLDIRVGYRWFDVNTTFGDQLLQKPLISNHRAFLNLGYETKNKWMFDYTFNWQGSKRIPFTGSNPVEYQLEERSPDFYLMNAQVSKAWNSGFEVYVGMENILDYRQHDPIIASGEPFGDYFDSSLVWGPIFGRNTYLGLRYRIR